MGRKIALLLVGLCLSLSVLAGETAGRVDARHYHAFWLWSGVHLPPALPNVQDVYLHQGEVLVRQGRAVLVPAGLPVTRLRIPRLWITLRLETIDISDALIDGMIRQVSRWRRAGNQVVGLQIDFDAATRRLSDYGDFLQRVRARLPAGMALGVTGLLDWAQTGSVAQLNRLPVDELVVQTYQGRTTVAGYDRYLSALSGLQIPFRVGIVQGGEWSDAAEKALSTSPWFTGMVVFVVKKPDR